MVPPDRPPPDDQAAQPTTKRKIHGDPDCQHCTISQETNDSTSTTTVTASRTITLPTSYGGKTLITSEHVVTTTAGTDMTKATTLTIKTIDSGPAAVLEANAAEQSTALPHVFALASTPTPTPTPPPPSYSEGAILAANHDDVLGMRNHVKDAVDENRKEVGLALAHTHAQYGRLYEQLWLIEARCYGLGVATEFYTPAVGGPYLSMAPSRPSSGLAASVATASPLLQPSPSRPVKPLPSLKTAAAATGPVTNLSHPASGAPTGNGTVAAPIASAQVTSSSLPAFSNGAPATTPNILQPRPQYPLTYGTTHPSPMLTAPSSPNVSAPPSPGCSHWHGSRAATVEDEPESVEDEPESPSPTPTPSEPWLHPTFVERVEEIVKNPSPDMLKQVYRTASHLYKLNSKPPPKTSLESRGHEQLIDELMASMAETVVKMSEAGHPCTPLEAFRSINSLVSSFPPVPPNWKGKGKVVGSVSFYGTPNSSSANTTPIPLPSLNPAPLVRGPTGEFTFVKNLVPSQSPGPSVPSGSTFNSEAKIPVSVSRPPTPKKKKKKKK